MNIKGFLLTAALGLLIATGAQADDPLYAEFLNTGIVGGIATHGGAPGDTFDFQGFVQNKTTENLYINKFDVQSTGALDMFANDISFDNNGSWWKTHFQYGSDVSTDPSNPLPAYVPLAPEGSVDPITGNPTDSVYWGDLFAAHTTSATQVGTYFGDFNIYGGKDINATDLLYTLQFSLDVVSGYDFSNTLVNPVQSAGPGETTAFYQSRYVNTGSQDVVNGGIIVWWFNDSLSGIDLGWGSGLSGPVVANSSIDADIFNLTIKPGTVPHSSSGYTSLYGGYYAGDSHLFNSDNWTLDMQRGPTAVPEPATLLGFGLPMLMIGLGKLRRMRK